MLKKKYVVYLFTFLTNLDALTLSIFNPGFAIDTNNIV